jgi:UDP-N-acetylmuramate--alanine ligase
MVIEMAHVHLIGIGGSGLSAIASLLLERGEVVSGSDRQMTPAALAVQAAGATVLIGHRAENIAGADMVVRSSAITDTNPEVAAAKAAGIPVFKRDGFLGNLLQGYRVIAVAGTHGKTTTTAMIAWVLTRLGIDPSYIIGSNALNLGGNAHAGKSDLFVIEADEYDRMFLGLSPTIAVVTNLEHDHPDCYPTPDDFYQAFAAFAGNIVPGGILLACQDDAGARRLLQEFAGGTGGARSYGLLPSTVEPQPDVAASALERNELGGTTFCVSLRQAQPHGEGLSAKVRLKLPGRHNVLNALAVMGVAHLLELPLADAAQALGEFRGTSRRFDVRGEVNGILVIDDYAHHPSEIRATLDAARERYPGRRLWALWQPHTYSRVRSLFDDFANAFTAADVVIVTEVYAAREAAPANGFSAASLVEAMPRKDVVFLPDLSQAAGYLLDSLCSGDVLLVLSAGDADQVSTEVISRLSAGRSV